MDKTVQKHIFYIQIYTQQAFVTFVTLCDDANVGKRLNPKDVSSPVLLQTKFLVWLEANLLPEIKVIVDFMLYTLYVQPFNSREVTKRSLLTLE